MLLIRTSIPADPLAGAADVMNPALRFERFVSLSFGTETPGCSAEVSLQRSSSADVQRHAMESTAQHLGVPELKRDDIEALLLQEPDQSGLVCIDHDQIGIESEQIHIDPIAANAPEKIVGIVPVRILHRRAVDDLPLLQTPAQGV